MVSGHWPVRRRQWQLLDPEFLIYSAVSLGDVQRSAGPYLLGFLGYCF